eukprot:5105514-Pleurochrysis_carterae.AAC.1
MPRMFCCGRLIQSRGKLRIVKLSAGAESGRAVYCAENALLECSEADVRCGLYKYSYPSTSALKLVEQHDALTVLCLNTGLLHLDDANGS